MNREDLEALDPMELIAYANLNFGLGVNKDYNRFDIINQVEQAQRKFKGNASMRVLDDGDTSEIPPGMMKIRIRPGKYDRIPRPIIIGHQFKIASVPVNKDVIMPAKYLVCFQDAVQDTYFTDESTKEWVCQEEFTYSYSVLGVGPSLNARPVLEQKEAVRRPIQPSIAEEEAAAKPAGTSTEKQLLDAVLALGKGMEALSERLEKVETAKAAPKPKKKVTKKRATKKD